MAVQERPLIAFALLFAVAIFQTGSGQQAASQVIAPVAAIRSQLQFHEASSAQKLGVEQVEQLLAAGQGEQALDLLQRLYDEAGDVLVVRPAANQFSDSVIQRSSGVPRVFWTLRDWVQWRRCQLYWEHPAVLAVYRQRVDATAASLLETARKKRDINLAQRVVSEYFASSSGDAALLLLSQLYADQGWINAAETCLEQISPALRAPIGESKNRLVGGRRWCEVFHQTKPDININAVAEYLQTDPVPAAWLVFPDSQLSMSALWNRLTAYRHLMGDQASVNIMQQISKAAFPGQQDDIVKNWLPREVNQEVAGVVPFPVHRSETLTDWPTFSGTPTRVAVAKSSVDTGPWPRWSHSLPRLTGHSDRIVEDEPRLSEVKNGILAYHPAVYENRVYVNDLLKINAYELGSGKPWPELDPPVPLFDSGLNDSNLVPTGYPSVGVPRGTVTVYDNCLYARMGQAVTGWQGQVEKIDGSFSYLIGLDLRREGRLLPGFPLRLTGLDWNGFEFEGCPVVQGDDLWVTVAESSSVNLRRFVACFNRWNGELKWRSSLLSGGTATAVAHANLVAHQLLTYHEGTLYYSTNLGAIVALNAMSGSLKWACQYPLPDGTEEAYGKSLRYRFRDMMPCVYNDRQLVCAPNDSPHVFMLDASTGEAMWIAPAEWVGAVSQCVGFAGRQLLLGGDRLLWLDRYSGNLLCGFPAATTSGADNALPQPRGLGRAAMTDKYVYWPTGEDVFVFDVNVSQVPVDPGDNNKMTRWEIVGKKRLQFGTRAAEGGNLILASGWLLMTTPSRLVAFQGETFSYHPE